MFTQGRGGQNIILHPSPNIYTYWQASHYHILGFLFFEISKKGDRESAFKKVKGKNCNGGSHRCGKLPRVFFSKKSPTSISFPRYIFSAWETEVRACAYIYEKEGEMRRNPMSGPPT